MLVITSRRTLGDYLRIPLAIASRLVFVTVRLIMRGFVAVGRRSAGRKGGKWRVVSAAMLERPLSLPVFLTRAPRWNTHAIIAMAGPLDAQREIGIDAGTLNRSAADWYLAVQPERGGKEMRLTRASLTSFDAVWHPLPVGPGRYSLTLRYYGPSETVDLPAIQIDGKPAVQKLPVPTDNNRFYDTLAERNSAFYRLLNYHVYVLLRFGDLLPSRFVSRVFLPAADSGMLYRYGAVRAGETVDIESPQEMLDAWTLCLTIYDIASFPVQSRVIDCRKFVSKSSVSKGFFLLRLLPKASTLSGADRIPIHISVRR